MMRSVGELFREEKGLARIDLMAIIGHVLSLSKEEILMEPGRKVEREALEKIRGLATARLRGRPLAYITGRREFYSETFLVDERVLIPRPETEAIVERATALLKEKRRPGKVLDMGTGSGIIGILLARETGSEVFCVDLSRDALMVAQKNRQLLGAAGRTHLLCGDLLGSFRAGVLFDLIVANLPYIPSSQWPRLMADVRDFEPKLALLGGEEGVEIYRRFLPDAVSFLKKDGHLLCEIGGEEQAIIVARLLSGAGLLTRTGKDLSGQDRFVEASWTNLS
jgi:release factor glutamine methyltransferase